VFQCFLFSDATVWHYKASAVRSLVNNGLERTESGVVVACSRWFPNNYLEGLKKTMKNLSGKAFRDSNWVLSKYRYNSTICLTSALNWGSGEGSTPWSGPFIHGKETRYSLYRRLGGPQGRSGRVRKISLPTVVRLSGRKNPTRSKSVYRLSPTSRPSRPVLG